MGIPKFFKWLTRRYPLILQNIKKEEECPPTDNLYLDLNGIIHNCIHGNDKKRHERVSQLEDFEEVWVNIMRAIDELMHTVKPRKVLYIAVDGVAPRAKMNQQRARRFRAAKDAMMLRDQLQSQGKNAPDLFDSNAISPGTKFMFELNKQLEFFVNYKLNTDPYYQKLDSVVFSGVTIPGEGEHKMMDYIRQIKLKEGYDPNTRHCFYGADADLIMLSLLTHEPHFTIIREEHIVKKVKQGGVQRIDLQRTSNFQLIHISLLREYFQLEYQEFAVKMKIPFNVERIIDDFAFFCFFIGNDFLPSLSTLDISEGSLDHLIDFYKLLLPQMNDYITENGQIFWDRAEPFINLLGNHEHETIIKRLKEIGHHREKIISFDIEFDQSVSKVDRNTLINQKIKSKILQKKLQKVQQLNLKQKAKQYKRFKLIKRFQEDDEPSDHLKNQKKEAIIKYQRIRDLQRQQSGYKTEEVKEEFNLEDIIGEIKDEYLSDLNPEDVPDSDVSDVNEEELDLENMFEGEINTELDNKILVQTKLAEKYSEQNYEFMVNFVKQYAEDPFQAKAGYYKMKMKFDINTEEGKQVQKKMLKKYLEGLQWVLYYYYRGVQHWRWFYPFHYAPLISDLGTNIMHHFLGGNQTISQFEIDSNCSQINAPYTPFQQLLAIMPLRSIKLLPPAYESIASGLLAEYFPLDFDIDLNGRTLPWEAVCLIPFVEEHKFLQAETDHIDFNQFDEDDQRRNRITFIQKSYRFDPKRKDLPMYPQTLTNYKALKSNFVVEEQIDDYEQVGNFSFDPVIHPKAVLPQVDYPSFKWLDVKEIEYDFKYVNKVNFKRVLVKVPSRPEEKNPDELEKFTKQFVQRGLLEVYYEFPFQIEGFPIAFENAQFYYALYQDTYDAMGRYYVHKQQQQGTVDQFEARKKRIKYRYQDRGIMLEDFNILVSVSQMINLSFDSHNKCFYKNYAHEDDNIVVPFSLLMQRRNPKHYLNQNERVSAYIKQFQSNKEAVCLNMQLFGVVGKVQKIVNLKNGLVNVMFDKESEELKIHDPFIAHNCLQNNNNQAFVKKENIKRYVTDTIIERMLKLKQGTVNRITGSILVQYIDKPTLERHVIDLGLNLKNFTKKVHIPDYVRFVQSDEVADYQYDGYEHNIHARGAKHVRKYFEYSDECVEIIKNYYMLFPEIFEFMQKLLSNNRGRNGKPVNDLRDIFPNLESNQSVQKVKTISGWIESLPISQMPYVEMGFNTLNTDLISRIEYQQNQVKEQFQSVNLRCSELETMKCTSLYVENFPYWTGPFSPKQASDFNVGDRVMNVNSVKREYVPFGLRGTVVGRTTEKVIVLFDEQYLNGSDIYGHCDKYRGGQIEPSHLINLTRKFSSMQDKNFMLVQQFQEQPQTSEIMTTMSNNQPQPQPQFHPQIQTHPQHKPQAQIKTHAHVQAQHQTQTQTQTQSQGKYAVRPKPQAQPEPQVQQTHVAENTEEEQKVKDINAFLETLLTKKQDTQPQFQQNTQYQTQVEEEKVPVQHQEFIPQKQVAEVQQQQEISFQFNPQLNTNPDFQSLMSLMQLAQQMQVPIPNPTGFSQQNQQQQNQEDPNKNLNLGAKEFVPSWKKQE